MGSALGILAKKKNVSEMFKYLQERFEIKKLTKDEATTKKSDHALIQKAFKKYDLEEIEKLQKKINGLTDDASREGYKLAMNNFILLRVLITNLEELKEELTKISKKTRNKEVFKLNGEVVTDLKIVQDYLQKAQKQLFDLYKEADSKGAYNLSMKIKEVGFVDLQFWNYFKMRAEAKTMTKNLSKLVANKEKAEKLIQKMEKQGITKQEEATMMKEIKNLVTEGRVSTKKAFLLFTNLNLLLHVIVGVINKELQLDVEAVKKHIIPQAMGFTDVQTKENIIKHLKEELHTELKVIQQEYKMAA
jgi:hypothetical protein